MSAKAKPWIFSNCFCLKFLAKPQPAVAAARAARIPHIRENNASKSSKPPFSRMGSMLSPAMESISLAMIRGSRHSRITSPVMYNGDRTVSFRYSPTLCNSVLTILSSLFYMLIYNIQKIG